MGSRQSNTGLSMKAKAALVTSVVKQLALAADCQSIMITLQDTSGDSYADLATLRLDDYEMTLMHSSEDLTTSVRLRRTEQSER